MSRRVSIANTSTAFHVWAAHIAAAPAIFKTALGNRHTFRAPALPDLGGNLLP